MNLSNQAQNRKPPVATTGIMGWLRMNLFSSWFNTIVTILVLYFLYQNPCMSVSCQKLFLVHHNQRSLLVACLQLNSSCYLVSCEVRVWGWHCF